MSAWLALEARRTKPVKELSEVIKVSRPGFWPTQLWFYTLPLATVDCFGSPAFWLGCVYVQFPLGLLLYGWNDLGDSATDRINARKDSWLFGATPDAGLRRRLPVWIAAVQAPFLAAFVWLLGWKVLPWAAALLMVNYSYNNLRFKSRPALDLLNQVGYLLIFVLASWLCGVPQLNGPAMVFSTLFAMQSHLFGQLMDIDADRIAGRKSTAVTIGVRPAKGLLVAIMLAEVVIALRFFQSPIVAWFMAGGAAFFALDAVLGPKRYPLWFTRGFFILWNVIVLVTMHWVWRYGLFMLAET